MLAGCLFLFRFLLFGHTIDLQIQPSHFVIFWRRLTVSPSMINVPSPLA
jgi:hypothetical protein